jgi:hypothetical protein
VSHYVLKTFDDSGRLIDRFEFAAPCDEEAQGAVSDLNPIPTAHELWCGRRLISGWPAIRR